MYKSSLTLLILFVSIFVMAQTNHELRIYHKLMNTTLNKQMVGQNNLSHNYKVSRIEYYLSRFTIIHDGGQQTIVPDSVIALINIENGLYSSVNLGNYSITNPEAVQFHIGVYAPVNNQDPGNYSQEHPLGPKSPSMHWGWQSGYRFLVYEGTSGNNFSQTYQLHALGNTNYKETNVIPVQAVMDGGTRVLMIDAHYEKGLKNINMNSAPIEHGTNQEDKMALDNFLVDVFSTSSESLGLSEELTADSWKVFPNPGTGKFQIKWSSNAEAVELSILDLQGKTIRSWSAFGQLNFDFEEKGVFLIQVKDQNGNSSIQKFVNQ